MHTIRRILLLSAILPCMAPLCAQQRDAGAASARQAAALSPHRAAAFARSYQDEMRGWQTQERNADAASELALPIFEREFGPVTLWSGLFKSQRHGITRKMVGVIIDLPRWRFRKKGE